MYNMSGPPNKAQNFPGWCGLCLHLGVCVFEMRETELAIVKCSQYFKHFLLQKFLVSENKSLSDGVARKKIH